MNSNPWETEFETDGIKYCFMLFKNKDAYYGYILKLENNHKVLRLCMKAAECKTYMELPVKNYHLSDLTLSNMIKGFKLTSGSEIPEEAQSAIAHILENFIRKQKGRTHQIQIPDRKNTRNCMGGIIINNSTRKEKKEKGGYLVFTIT